MPIAGVPHQRAVRALEKAGFQIVRQGGHIVMSDGTRIATIPRHDPVNGHTMAVIVRSRNGFKEGFFDTSGFVFTAIVLP